MRESIRRMRPMGIADILDETVELYKTSFALLMGIAAVLYVPYSVFQGWFTMKYFPQMDFGSPSPQVDWRPLVGAAAVGVLYMLVVTPFVTGATTYAISERYLGRRTTVVTSFRRVLSAAVFWRMLLAVLISIVVMVGLWAFVVVLVVLCVLAGALNTSLLFAAIPVAFLLILGAAFGALYLLLRLALIECIIVVEMKGFTASLARAWSLMKGSVLKCFLVLAVSMVVVWIVQSMVAQPTNSLITASMLQGGKPSQLVFVLHTLIVALSSTLLAPITSIVTILLYYDIRIRKEGFDLELLASELHAKSQQAPAWAGQPLPQEQVTTQLPQEQAPPEEGPSPQ